MKLLAGAAWGLLLYAFTVILAALRTGLNPGLWSRVTGESLLWTAAFAVFFAAAGAACAAFSLVPLRVARYVLIGGTVGALVWSYVTMTWELTASATALYPPTAGALEAAATGAAAGALGGLALYGLALLRPHPDDA